jgi:hypothetical protein
VPAADVFVEESDRPSRLHELGVVHERRVSSNAHEGCPNDA